MTKKASAVTVIQILANDGEIFGLGNDGELYVYDTETYAWADPEFEPPASSTTAPIAPTGAKK